MIRCFSFVIYGLFVLILAAACTLAPKSTEQDAEALPEADMQVESSNNATLALLDTARRQSESGNLEAAAAVIERALRIEPKNPGLWHQLAKIRFKQGQFRTAISLAAKSSSFADKGSELISRNKALIREARSR